MLDFIIKGLGKVFGTKSARDIKTLLPVVEQIKAEYNKLQQLSDEELRAQTTELKSLLNADLKSFDDQILKYKEEINALAPDKVHAKDALFNEIDKVDKSRNEALEASLEKILPRAFAVVKETARRLKENETLRVKANERDQELAAVKPNVVIEGDEAVWYNKWNAAGLDVTWDMVHYDVQLLGGVVLHRGNIAEMATGEGKTLVSTLPAYLNALSGRGVHIVTVNDYLAKRDSEWNAPIFEFHGLTVDCIDKYPPNSPGRKKAYASDIVYGTNNEFGFDYLRDNMARDAADLVQVRHHFAMIDEVDSVLIDDARTPLIISGPIPKGDEQLYDLLRPRVEVIVKAQRDLATRLLAEAKQKMASSDTKEQEEGASQLFRSYKAMPKNKPLIKYLSEQGVKAAMLKTEGFYMQEQMRNMHIATDPLYFVIEEKMHSVELTDKGIDLITGDSEDPQFFVLPDIGSEIAV